MVFKSHADHLVFVRQRSTGLTVLTVYVDDIIVIGSDTKGIDDTKLLLQKHFVMKDMGKLCYYSGIEIVRSNQRVSLG